MNKDRAIHEFRLLTIEMMRWMELVDHARAPSVIATAKKLLDDTESFRESTTMEMLKQWEAERFKERGWSKSPTQGI